MTRKLRILVPMHEDLVPPDSIEGLSDEQMAPWKTEYDIVVTLKDIGHQVQPLGVSSDLGVVGQAIEQFKPHIAFNLLEEFHGVGLYDQHVVSYLELVRLPYTGCNPRGLTLAHDKALTKMILNYHRIRVPAFGVFPIDKAVRRPKRLQFPLLVKSLTEEGSVGIAQASIVHDDQHLAERVEFVHRQLQTHAIAEQYIEGRELYVGVIGNDRLQTFPIWELSFTKLRDDAPRIATGKVKWDLAYRKKVGATTRAAHDLPPGLETKIPHLCKRIYRTLGLSGYARIDLRLTPDGRVYLLEANPNPELAYGEDFAESAETTGVSYEQLLHRILHLGLTYRPRGLA
ncbi:MAG: ATP-grasp domain-containing protein [Phycisphaeraceae bacterium]